MPLRNKSNLLDDIPHRIIELVFPGRYDELVDFHESADRFVSESQKLISAVELAVDAERIISGKDNRRHSS